MVLATIFDPESLRTRSRLSFRVAHGLWRRVIDGVYRPGDWLPHDEALQAELGIGRTTLREAMMVLECLGVIASRHGAGRQVLDQRRGYAAFLPKDLDVIGLLEAGRLFEGQAVELAVRLGPPHRSLPLAWPATRSPAPRLTVAECQIFHTRLARLAQNNAIAASIENLWRSAAHGPIGVSLDGALAPAAGKVRRLQRAVLTAVRARRAEQARQVVNQLFDLYVAAFLGHEERLALGRIRRESHRLRQTWGRRLHKTQIAEVARGAVTSMGSEDGRRDLSVPT
jgi:DNA-binding FadR family transcriptional regulator